MELNQYLRAAALVVLGALGSFQVNAYTGGVTTYNKPTPTNVERVSKSTAAAGPERDATYQRVMRKAQTSAAAGKAVRGLLRSLTGIGTILAVVDLAKELSAQVKETPDKHIEFMKVEKLCTVDPCYAYADGTGAYPFRDASAACSNIADRFVKAQNGNWAATLSSTGGDGPNAACTGTKTQTLAGSEPQPWFTQPSWTTVAVDNSVPNQTGTVISDSELDQKLADWPGLPLLLDGLNEKGHEILWSGEEVEDMPQPIVLSPTIKIKPDGSKEIEQTTLTPYRGPDGKTINWGRKLTFTEESPPDAAGNTIKKTTTTTSDAPPSEAKKDDRPECEKSPDTLGCIKMDTPEADIPRVNKDVSYVAESLFGSAACPQSRVISQSLTGHPIYLHFTPTCDALATYLKPMVIAIALFMAYLIILPGNRE